MSELPIQRHKRQNWPFNPPFTVDYDITRATPWALIAGLAAGALGAAIGAIISLKLYTFDTLAPLLFGGLLWGSLILIVGVAATIVWDMIFNVRDERDDEAEIVEL